MRVRVAHDAEDLVALIEEKLGQIRAVLSRDTGDQGPLGHRLSLLRLATAADGEVHEVVDRFAHARCFEDLIGYGLFSVPGWIIDWRRLAHDLVDRYYEKCAAIYSGHTVRHRG